MPDDARTPDPRAAEPRRHLRADLPGADLVAPARPALDPDADPGDGPRGPSFGARPLKEESVSGAMTAYTAAGAGGPLPRTDAADDGRHGHVDGTGTNQTAAGDAGDVATRRDPSPDRVPGPDDAGSQGRDRASGGWGDRGIGGGRAGGTGL